MVVVDGLRDDAVVAVADEIFVGGGGDADLQAFFDHTGLEAAAAGRGGEAEEELEWLSNKDAFPTVETIAPAPAPAPAVVASRTKGERRRPRMVAWSPSQALQPRPRAVAAGRRCRHCGTKRTPQWRDGPEGRRTLCNACGVRYRSGRLLPEYRPVNSPTFSPELHSNKHRRVVEMHRRPNKDAYPTVEMTAPASAPAPAVVAPRTKGVCPTFSSNLHSNKYRRPNKDASATVETIAPAPAPAPAVVAPRTKGVRPTSYPELHYNKHRRVMEIQRRPNKGVSATVETIASASAPAVVAPRTKGVRRRRRTVAWSPPQALLPRLPTGRRCRHCGTERTPQWREGPEGRGTLCNACGVQYRKGRLLPEYRPVDSPTFSPVLHSNKHRCVVEMRRRRGLPAASASDK